MNPKNVWRLSRPHQTYSHNLHFKITGLARRFNPETVLRQDALLLYNPKECRGKKCLSFLPPWEFQNPLSLGTPRLLINLPRKWFSQMVSHSIILSWRIPWAEEPGRLQSMGSQRVWQYWLTNTFQISINYNLGTTDCQGWKGSLEYLTQPNKIPLSLNLL